MREFDLESWSCGPATPNLPESICFLDIGKTPVDRRDDTVAKSSSPGFGRFLPTVSAHGTNARMFDAAVATGTSFSAPVVVAIVALMLEQNPRLKLQEVKDILQRTSTRLNASKEKQGAGAINVDLAVFKARARSRAG